MYKELSKPLSLWKDGHGRLIAWQMNGQPTVVLRVSDREGMMELMQVY